VREAPVFKASGHHLMRAVAAAGLDDPKRGKIRNLDYVVGTTLSSQNRLAGFHQWRQYREDRMCNY